MRSLLVASALVLAIGSPSALAGDSRTRAKADAWIGHDASELLLQLRVDGGRVVIRENEDTGETYYTWNTINAAYIEDRVVGATQEVVGINGGTGPQAGTPIIQSHAITTPVFHPATQRCIVTFAANSEGIISGWEFSGPQCNFDIEKPKSRR